MVELPQYGSVFPDDVLARLRDLESAVMSLQRGEFSAVVTLDGDVTGQSSATTVARIRNQTVEATTPAEHDVLSYGYNDDAEAVWSPGYVKQLNGRQIVFDDPSGQNYEPGLFIVNNSADMLDFRDSVSTIWGSGVDGSRTLNSANTMPDWADRTGSGNNTVITLLRDVYCTSLSLVGTGSEGGTTFYNIAVDTNGFRIFCTRTLSLTAGVTLRNNGGAASGSTAGIAGPANALQTGKDGGAGSTATGAGGAGSTKSIVSFEDGTSVSGGAGGAATGGPGVGGGTPGGASSWYASDGSPHALMQAVSVTASDGDRFEGGAGGSGGNGSTGTGGGGGAGGGIVAIYSRKIVNNGTIQANGGNGGNATGTNGGGGGGGGGGAVIAVYLDERSTLGTVQVLGGTGGSAIGTGKDGADGADGYFWDIAL